MRDVLPLPPIEVSDVPRSGLSRFVAARVLRRRAVGLRANVVILPLNDLYGVRWPAGSGVTKLHACAHLHILSTIYLSFRAKGPLYTSNEAIDALLGHRLQYHGEGSLDLSPFESSQAGSTVRPYVRELVSMPFSGESYHWLYLC